MDCFSGAPVEPDSEITVRLIHGQPGDARRRLQHGGRDVAGADGGDRVGAAVEAHDDHLVEPRRFERGRSAQRHRVVARDDALDAAVRLDHGFHLLERFGLAPVGALPGHQLQVGILVEHIVVALGADGGVGVGFARPRSST